MISKIFYSSGHNANQMFYLVYITIYIIKQDIRIYKLYMLRIVGKTVGPIGLKFFVDTHGFFPSIFFPWATPGLSASESYIS